MKGYKCLDCGNEMFFQVGGKVVCMMCNSDNCEEKLKPW